MTTEQALIAWLSLPALYALAGKAYRLRADGTPEVVEPWPTRLTLRRPVIENLTGKTTRWTISLPANSQCTWPRARRMPVSRDELTGPDRELHHDRMRAARAAAVEAEERYHAVIRDVCPIGSYVTWTKNGVHAGRVTRHSQGSRIKVKNALTDREYWIDAYLVKP